MENQKTQFNKDAHEMWSAVTVEQRAALLEAMGYKTEWAQLGTLQEVIRRGGGMIRNSIVDLMVKRNERMNRVAMP